MVRCPSENGGISLGSSPTMVAPSMMLIKLSEPLCAPRMKRSTKTATCTCGPPPPSAIQTISSGGIRRVHGGLLGQSSPERSRAGAGQRQGAVAPRALAVGLAPRAHLRHRPGGLGGQLVVG